MKIDMPEEVYRVPIMKNIKDSRILFLPFLSQNMQKKPPEVQKNIQMKAPLGIERLSPVFYSFSLFESSAGSSCGKIMEEDSGTLRSRDSHVTKRDGMEIVGEISQFHNKTVPKSFATKRTGRLVGTE